MDSWNRNSLSSWGLTRSSRPAIPDRGAFVNPQHAASGGGLLRHWPFYTHPNCLRLKGPFVWFSSRPSRAVGTTGD